MLGKEVANQLFNKLVATTMSIIEEGRELVGIEIDTAVVIRVSKITSPESSIKADLGSKMFEGFSQLLSRKLAILVSVKSSEGFF